MNIKLKGFLLAVALLSASQLTFATKCNYFNLSGWKTCAETQACINQAAKTVKMLGGRKQYQCKEVIGITGMCYAGSSNASIALFPC